MESIPVCQIGTIYCCYYVVMFTYDCLQIRLTKNLISILIKTTLIKTYRPFKTTNPTAAGFKTTNPTAAGFKTTNPTAAGFKTTNPTAAGFKISTNYTCAVCVNPLFLIICCFYSKSIEQTNILLIYSMIMKNAYIELL